MSDHWRISAGEKLIEELRIHDSDMANEAADEITSLRQRLSSAEAELECLRHAAPVVDVAVVVDAERAELRRRLAEAEAEIERLRAHSDFHANEEERYRQLYEMRGNTMEGMDRLEAERDELRGQLAEVEKERDELRVQNQRLADLLSPVWPQTPEEEAFWDRVEAEDKPRTSLPLPGETAP